MKVDNFLFEVLKKQAERILSKNEIKYLPNVTEIKKSHIPFCDLVFVIERFLNNKLYPQNWEIYYSSKFDHSRLNENHKKNLVRLEVLLKSGSNLINSNSVGFLPKSSKRYFESTIGDNFKKRYTVDFTNQFFGIRHFHLDYQNRNEDILLFYVKHQNIIYFIQIGNHNDLYSQSNIELLIEEYPHLLQSLGIGALSDMPIGKNPMYTSSDIRNLWTSGNNVGFVIDNKYYTSANPQTLSRLNSEIISIVQNIYYQIKVQMEELESILEKENDIEKQNLEFNVYIERDINPINNGNLILKEELTGTYCELTIDYLKRSAMAERILENGKI